jgi:hypothetical protein
MLMVFLLDNLFVIELKACPPLDLVAAPPD